MLQRRLSGLEVGSDEIALGDGLEEGVVLFIFLKEGIDHVLLGLLLGGDAGQPAVAIIVEDGFGRPVGALAAVHFFHR